MRFFKYLVFIFFSLISLDTLANQCTVYGGAHSATGTATEACRSLYLKLIGSDIPSTLKANITGTSVSCSAFSGNQFGSGSCSSQCTAGATTVQSGNFNISNWANDNELTTLMDQSYNHFSGSSKICASGCEHNFSHTTNKSGTESEKSLVMTGVFVSTDKTCSGSSSAPDGSAVGTGTPNDPNDPDNPDNPEDPEDPGSTDGKGFDDSRIIAAINAMSASITNKLTQVSTQITNSISQMSASITDKIGITNGKLDQVKAEIEKNVIATNAVKAAVDTNTNVVNANGDKVKNAVDANRTAVNANGDKVKTAVDANTTAVNANGDKVKTAVDTNTTAVNANGDKIKRSVDDNTVAVKEGNGTLQDIKNWLTGDVDTSGFAAQAPQHEIEKQSFKTDIFRGSAQCPQDRTLSLNLFAGRSFQKTFSFQIWCDYLAILGNLILLASYCYGALIVVRNT